MYHNFLYDTVVGDGVVGFGVQTELTVTQFNDSVVRKALIFKKKSSAMAMGRLAMG